MHCAVTWFDLQMPVRVGWLYSIIQVFIFLFVFFLVALSVIKSHILISPATSNQLKKFHFSADFDLWFRALLLSTYVNNTHCLKYWHLFYFCTPFKNWVVSQMFSVWQYFRLKVYSVMGKSAWEIFSSPFFVQLLCR